MNEKEFEIRKSSGKTVPFSMHKLHDSLSRSGADDSTINEVLGKVKDELYAGITTKEIYNRAFAILKKNKPVFASKYKLKKAIYELGPSGFPFEKFISTLLNYSGYNTQVGKVVSGKCVQHEIDIFAKKNGKVIIIECKFHGEEGRNCNVKVPLYIHSRYSDVRNATYGTKSEFERPDEGWVVTNTRFTSHAISYGECADLYLLSWDYPKDNGLRNRIDRLGLYPITVSTLMTRREKEFLLSRDIVLCRQLHRDKFYLDHMGVSESRKSKILDEVASLCNF